MTEFKEINKEILLAIPYFNFNIQNSEKISDFKEKILQFINKTEKTIFVLNLQNCNFLDSFGLGNLLKIYEQIHIKKGKLFVCNVNKSIKNLFDITNLGNYLTYLDNCNNLESLISIII